VRGFIRLYPLTLPFDTSQTPKQQIQSRSLQLAGEYHVVSHAPLDRVGPHGLMEAISHSSTYPNTVSAHHTRGVTISSVPPGVACASRVHAAFKLDLSVLV
jgi:hypothetical protein